MKTVWRFELKIKKEQKIEMPRSAVFLSVQIKNEKIWLWALVDPSLEKEFRYFEVFGTGHDIDDQRRIHIGTCQFNSGLVFHVFEYLMK